jgi:hypothetical protein
MAAKALANLSCSAATLGGPVTSSPSTLPLNFRPQYTILPVELIGVLTCSPKKLDMLCVLFLSSVPARIANR